MNKQEIQEQINKLQKELDKLKDQEREFKVGDWVYAEKRPNYDNRLIRYIPIFQIKGFAYTDLGVAWMTPEIIHGVKDYVFQSGMRVENCRHATPKEIESYLIKQAKEMGYEGKRIYIMTGLDTGEVSVDKMTKYYTYFPLCDTLMSTRLGARYSIYSAGKWAKIVEEKIMVCGHEVKVIHEDVNIGCKTKSKDMVSCLRACVFLFNSYGGCKITSIAIDGDCCITPEDLSNIEKALSV
jgi:hypothetical protein